MVSKSAVSQCARLIVCKKAMAFCLEFSRSSCVLLLVVSFWSHGSFSEPLTYEWEQYTRYVKMYEKPYRNDIVELAHRFGVFQQSLVRHRKLNDLEQDNKGTAVYGVNKFSDLTPEEFKSRYLSPTRNVRSARNDSDDNNIGTMNCDNVQKAFDWRDHKVTTPIKNQEHCGSCWAFSVVETLESAWAIQNHTSPIELSSQQLISCLYNPAENLFGCKGAVLGEAFSAVQYDSGPVVPAIIYPFTSGDGSSPPPACMPNLPNKGVNLTKYEYTDSISSECNMVKMLTTHSPLSTSANALMWQDYISGIIQHHCSGSELDHAVQVVGYNLNNDPVPYWIVRNTWGPDWGENGYVRLIFGQGTCGITEEVAWIDTVSGVGL